MRNYILLIISIFIFSNFSAKAQSESVCEDIASKSIQWLNTDNSEKLFIRYSKTVADQISAKATASIWTQLESQYGEFVKVDTLIKSTVNGSLIIDQLLAFSKGGLKYRLSFDANNSISGIFFIPYRRARAVTTQSNKFVEKQVMFVSDGIDFPAMFCFPKNQKSKAVVILVHGSGPNDMDQTIGPNKIFKQLANKLAEHGIASLRYDKRSYLAQQGRLNTKLKTDINHIVVNDAVAAAKFVHGIDSLSNLPRIIVGHSLGAHMAPEIARQSGSVNAIVMLAANARPLEDLILEQYKYLFGRGGLTSVEKKEIKSVKKKVKKVKKLDKYIAKGKMPELPLTNDTVFWNSMNHYDALLTAKKLQKPILIMQGGRDYQVTMTDFNLWTQNFKSSISHDQTFIEYSTLNHLFIKGTSKSYPDEYNHKGEVSDNMVKDMADWIKSIWGGNSMEPKLKRGITHNRKG